jgi:hypothetical protein
MQTEEPITVIKASGKEAPFSHVKLRESLKQAGATDEAIKGVMEAIEPQLYAGVPTRKLYKIAFQELKNRSPYLAARYDLKRAIMALGPSGFPFEKFVGELLRKQGFRVQVGVIVQGHCVSHEIDVVAVKGDQHYMVECKYHNHPGTVSDVKVPLYIQARFQDVVKGRENHPDHKNTFHQGWVVTNTRFTPDAIAYGTCAGLNLMSWDYPRHGSLRDIIDKMGLYPITALTTLTAREKQLLLEREIVLCEEICIEEHLLRPLGLPQERLDAVLEEARYLCRRG